MMKKLLLFACVSILFAACTKDDDGGGSKPGETLITVDFEAATLGADGYLWGKPLAVTNPDSESLEFSGVIYSEKGASFLSYFSDFGGVWDTWCRFAVSGKHDIQTEGTDNQFSVYTTLDDKQNKFAVAYDMKGMGPGYTFNPTLEFEGSVEVRSVMMANATWTYLYLSKQYSDYSIDVIGFDGEKEVGKVSVPLAFDNTVVDNWQEVDLSSLGRVTKLIFAVETDDVMAPTYFCMDDLVYTKPILSTPKFDVVSFEEGEELQDVEANPVKLTTANVVGGSAAGAHQNVCWGKGGVYASYYQQIDGSNVYDGYLCSTADENIWFGTYYSEGFYNGVQNDFWGGFILTSNYNKTASTVDYKNQFSAWASTGANGTKNCMVGYDASFAPDSYALPTIEFVKPRTVDHLYMTNSTVTYAHTPTAAVPANETYYYKVVVTGSLNGVGKGKVECLLVYGDDKTADWKKFSFATLGEVDKLEFKPVSNDANSWGIVAPGYFCIDEIALVRK